MPNVPNAEGVFGDGCVPTVSHVSLIPVSIAPLPLYLYLVDRRRTAQSCVVGTIPRLWSLMNLDHMNDALVHKFHFEMLVEVPAPSC